MHLLDEYNKIYEMYGTQYITTEIQCNSFNFTKNERRIIKFYSLTHFEISVPPIWLKDPYYYLHSITLIGRNTLSFLYNRQIFPWIISEFAWIKFRRHDIDGSSSFETSQQTNCSVLPNTLERKISSRY